ncbi:MAG: cytochrome C', partial [Betaproteobacteria bacterium]|nr:cytochrome C' [Betaproteobacteria bacterium]
MKTVIFAAAAAAVVLAAPARADEAMAKKYNCLACHQTDKKLVGPSYKDIAKKYKGQAGAA